MVSKDVWLDLLDDHVGDQRHSNDFDAAMHADDDLMDDGHSNRIRSEHIPVDASEIWYSHCRWVNPLGPIRRPLQNFGGIFILDR